MHWGAVRGVVAEIVDDTDIGVVYQSSLNESSDVKDSDVPSGLGVPMKNVSGSKG